MLPGPSDGFCLWPTKTTTRAPKRVSTHDHIQTKEVEINYSVMDTPFKRDGIAELAAAFRKKGLGFGIHFSNVDWNDYRFRWDFNNRFYDPKYSRKTNPEDWRGWIEQHRKQILELASNYGPLMAISFDTGGIPLPADSFPDIVKTIKMVRKLQPECLFRNRGLGAYGDFDTPEGRVPSDPRGDRERVWEAIDFIGGAWGWQPGDNYKPKEWIVATLIEAVSKGGNCCLNVSPMPSGRFDPEYVSRLEYVGDWLKVNGEAIYKTRPRQGDLWKEGNDIRFTRNKDNKTVYAICLKWPGERLALRSVRAKEGSQIRMLGVPTPLPWRQDADALTITIPADIERAKPCRQAYALKIEVAASSEGS
jgi:alpha-L-fucosidase